MRVTTIGKRGLKLPVGSINSDGSLDQSFSLRPYKSKIDRHLGAWKETNAPAFNGDEGRMLSHTVAKFVSLILDSAAGKSFPVTEDGNSTAEAELAINQWPLSDVFYVYMMARIASLGNQMVAPASCTNPACRWHGDLTYDLTSLDVKYCEKAEDLETWVELKKPFTGRSGQLIKSVRIGPVRWVALTKPGVLQSKMSELEYHTLMDAIYGINGDSANPYTLTMDELDEMERIDRATINKVADRTSAGFDFKTVSNCPKCGTAIINPLDWTFDHFFGDSVPLEI